MANKFMLNESMSFPKKEANDYPPIPKGIYQAELLTVDANENETYDSKKKNLEPKQYQTDLAYQFVLLAGSDKNGSLRGRNVWENFGHNFLYVGKNGKNNLYRIVEAFLKREITREEEAQGISAKMLNSFIGKQILLSIEPKKSKDGSKTFDKISDYFQAQADFQHLTADEKEKARVKKDEEKQEDTKTETKMTPAEAMQYGLDSVAKKENKPEEDIDVSQIPF